MVSGSEKAPRNERKVRRIGPNGPRPAYMSYLLFLDESGHDHKAAPYEVTGGVALHVSKLWQLVQHMQRLELEAFGVRLSEYRSELKGSKLLNRYRFKGEPERDRLHEKEDPNKSTALLTK